MEKMKVVVIGTGASGWITVSSLLKLDFVESVKIIGSSTIPSIGVGESTTLSFFENFLSDNPELIKRFVQQSDAAVKYGVYYKGWSNKDFLHHFKPSCLFQRNGMGGEETWGQLLSRKRKDDHIHDLIGSQLIEFSEKNEVSLNTQEYPHSWHFDAGKFIAFMQNEFENDPRVELVEDSIKGCDYSGNRINAAFGEKKTYIADYFVNCTGSHNVFHCSYKDYSQYLLTNKAMVFPLEYTNKEEQFHPFTVAKTMKYGWRWITPTQSRIGTGYVFSTDHISVDEAVDEFTSDIGDKSIQPKIVDFTPKVAIDPFKLNYCSIGMAQGFLEPLDAPGIAITLSSLNSLSEILSHIHSGYDELSLKQGVANINWEIQREYEFWCSFILHQYKTCTRDDTQFWIDQKNVNCNFYDQFIDWMIEVPPSLKSRYEFMMFWYTTAAKDIVWESGFPPPKLKEIPVETITHLDYINQFSSK